MLKKLIILFFLTSFSAYAIDFNELKEVDINTDKFFTYCTKDLDGPRDVTDLAYCVGLYNGFATLWILHNAALNKTNCSAPSFRDFSVRFNSLFYRNQLDTNSVTIVNIYKTLNTFCEK